MGSRSRSEIAFEAFGKLLLWFLSMLVMTVIGVQTYMHFR